MNRKILLFVLGILFGRILTAQEYESLVDTTKQWNIIQYQYDYEPNYDDLLYVNTIGERFRGDTIVDGLHYAFLEICKNDSTFENWKSTDWLFREDTVNQKVYAYTSGNEMLLYDFSFNVGDTFEVYNEFIVDSVKVEFVANASRKVIYFGNTCEGFCFIEGIGTYYDLLEPLHWCNVGGTVFNGLLCYSQNGELLYSQTDFCFKYQDYTSVIKTVVSADFRIYPNPVKDELSIEFNSTGVAYELIIYGLDGKVQLKKEIKNSKEKVALKGLTSGVYILQVFNDGIVCYSEKVVIE